MNRMARAAVLLKLIVRLDQHGSWCGETNVQKGTFLFQELFGAPLGFEFILYKHGPYSFDLTDELTALQADSVLEISTPDRRYGPRFRPGPTADFVTDRYGGDTIPYEKPIDFIASRFGSMGVAELERLSTACYIRKQNPQATPNSRAESLHELKPHIALEDALAATEKIDSICAEIGNSQAA